MMLQAPPTGGAFRLQKLDTLDPLPRMVYTIK